MQKGLHAPKYSKKFPGYHMKALHPHRKKNASLAMSIEIDNGEWRSHLHSHNFDEGTLFYSNPIFLNGWVCQTSHISSAETFPIPKVFLSKQTRVHAPRVSVMSSQITRAHQVDGLEIDETFLA